MPKTNDAEDAAAEVAITPEAAPAAPPEPPVPTGFVELVVVKSNKVSTGKRDYTNHKDIFVAKGERIIVSEFHAQTYIARGIAYDPNSND